MLQQNAEYNKCNEEGVLSITGDTEDGRRVNIHVVDGVRTMLTVALVVPRTASDISLAAHAHNLEKAFTAQDSRINAKNLDQRLISRGLDLSTMFTAKEFLDLDVVTFRWATVPSVRRILEAYLLRSGEVEWTRKLCSAYACPYAALYVADSADCTFTTTLAYARERFIVHGGNAAANIKDSFARSKATNKAWREARADTEWPGATVIDDTLLASWLAAGRDGLLAYLATPPANRAPDFGIKLGCWLRCTGVTPPKRRTAQGMDVYGEVKMVGVARLFDYERANRMPARRLVTAIDIETVSHGDLRGYLQNLGGAMDIFPEATGAGRVHCVALSRTYLNAAGDPLDLDITVYQTREWSDTVADLARRFWLDLFRQGYPQAVTRVKDTLGNEAHIFLTPDEATARAVGERLHRGGPPAVVTSLREARVQTARWLADRLAELQAALERVARGVGWEPAMAGVPTASAITCCAEAATKVLELAAPWLASVGDFGFPSPPPDVRAAVAVARAELAARVRFGQVHAEAAAADATTAPTLREIVWEFLPARVAHLRAVDVPADSGWLTLPLPYDPQTHVASQDLHALRELYERTVGEGMRLPLAVRVEVCADEFALIQAVRDRLASDGTQAVVGHNADGFDFKFLAARLYQHLPRFGPKPASCKLEQWLQACCLCWGPVYGDLPALRGRDRVTDLLCTDAFNTHGWSLGKGVPLVDTCTKDLYEAKHLTHGLSLSALARNVLGTEFDKCGVGGAAVTHTALVERDHAAIVMYCAFDAVLTLALAIMRRAVDLVMARADLCNAPRAFASQPKRQHALFLFLRNELALRRGKVTTHTAMPCAAMKAVADNGTATGGRVYNGKSPFELPPQRETVHGQTRIPRVRTLEDEVHCVTDFASLYPNIAISGNAGPDAKMTRAEAEALARALGIAAEDIDAWIAEHFEATTVTLLIKPTEVRANAAAKDAPFLSEVEGLRQIREWQTLLGGGSESALGAEIEEEFAEDERTIREGMAASPADMHDMLECLRKMYDKRREAAKCGVTATIYLMKEKYKVSAVSAEYKHFLAERKRIKAEMKAAAKRASAERAKVKELQARAHGASTLRCVACLRRIMRGEGGCVLACGHALHARCVTPHTACARCGADAGAAYDSPLNDADLLDPELADALARALTQAGVWEQLVSVLDNKQLAVKVLANGRYGLLVTKGVISFDPWLGCIITTRGRAYNKACNRFFAHAPDFGSLTGALRHVFYVFGCHAPRYEHEDAFGQGKAAAAHVTALLLERLDADGHLPALPPGTDVAAELAAFPPELSPAEADRLLRLRFAVAAADVDIEGLTTTAPAGTLSRWDAAGAAPFPVGDALLWMVETHYPLPPDVREGQQTVYGDTDSLFQRFYRGMFRALPCPTDMVQMAALVCAVLCAAVIRLREQPEFEGTGLVLEVEALGRCLRLEFLKRKRYSYKYVDPKEYTKIMEVAVLKLMGYNYKKSDFPKHLGLTVNVLMDHEATIPQKWDALYLYGARMLHAAHLPFGMWNEADLRTVKANVTCTCGDDFATALVTDPYQLTKRHKLNKSKTLDLILSGTVRLPTATEAAKASYMPAKVTAGPLVVAVNHAALTGRRLTPGQEVYPVTVARWNMSLPGAKSKFKRTRATIIRPQLKISFARDAITRQKKCVLKLPKGHSASRYMLAVELLTQATMFFIDYAMIVGTSANQLMSSVDGLIDDKELEVFITVLVGLLENQQSMGMRGLGHKSLAECEQELRERVAAKMQQCAQARLHFTRKHKLTQVLPDEEELLTRIAAVNDLSLEELLEFGRGDEVFVDTLAATLPAGITLAQFDTTLRYRILDRLPPQKKQMTLQDFLQRLPPPPPSPRLEHTKRGRTAEEEAEAATALTAKRRKIMREEDERRRTVDAQALRPARPLTQEDLDAACGDDAMAGEEDQVPDIEQVMAEQDAARAARAEEFLRMAVDAFEEDGADADYDVLVDNLI